MKKLVSVILAVMMLFSALFAINVSALDTAENNASVSFDTFDALYVHAVANLSDTEAWQAWQAKHDERFNESKPNEKYFFLPSSASDTEVEIYNAYGKSVTVNGVEIPSKQSRTVSYNTNDTYSVKAIGNTYTLKFMKSTAEAAIYVNNSDADGMGTELMTYLNEDKSRSAAATGAIVDASGNIDNTAVKKIKGRGNTTWDKAKKAYNITYSSSVSIAGMAKGKKYSILANYQDDSLSRNRFLYDLSDAVGMPYASDSRYVDFYANGYYWGSYQMTEKVEVGKNSLIPDVDDTAYLNSDGSVNADFPFLCEVDASAKEGEDYFVKTDSGNNVTIKAPELEPGDAGYEEVKAYVKKKFDAFFSATRTKTTDLSVYADVDSLIKIYLINELGKNWDAGVSSFFFTYKKDANGEYKFFASPVWDYDNSLGNAVGVESELRYMGVTDYKDYSGWWCRYKSRKSGSSGSTNNILNNISRHNQILKAAPQIWFEEFVPAINQFANNNYSAPNAEFLTKSEYYSRLSGSAEMNYESGWLLNTGSWIADHTSLTKATFDMSSKTLITDTKATRYENNFKGMYDYCADWMTSRAAWLSSVMISKYTPTVTLGDIDNSGVVDINDVSLLQKYCAGLETLTDDQNKAADVNNDGIVNVNDATQIQRYVAKLVTSLG